MKSGARNRLTNRVRKSRYNASGVAGRLLLDVLDEDFAVAGYPDAVAFLEFAKQAPVDDEPAFHDAAIDIVAFEA